jgi:outer membrane receptor for ferrienterochelin and colicin
MNKNIRFGASVLAALLVLMIPAALYAQETTSAIRVTVTSTDGQPVEGASVTITDTRSGSSRTSTTSGSGVVSASGLRVGGPYEVVVSAENYGSQKITEINLTLGVTLSIPVALSSGAMLEEVVVTAAMSDSQNLAVGPATVFGLADLEDLPAINRDIKDILRADPRVFVDDSDNGAINCAGANSRFNSFTLDGARMNDNFGLNRNGWPTERQPFPYDSIQQIAVEMAPFDVEYGGFSACNINAVTKSGDNEWHGSVFYDYTDDSMKGDKIEDDRIDNGSYDEKRYGFSLSGPIWKDRLFFFVAGEKLEGVQQFARSYAGSGAATEVEGVSKEQWDEIISIAQNLYGYEPGGLPRTLPIEDEKITAKIDWNINDDHRAVLTYNWNDGFSLSEPDGDSNELEDANHFYERGAELTVYTGMLFSNWTDRFSTELRVTDSELLNRQLSLGGTDFGEVTVTTYNNGERANVYLGSDDSRHANVLEHSSRNYKLAGNYVVGDHMITAGYERDELKIFNLFIQEAEGEFDFDGRSQCSSSNPNGCIEAFRMGIPDDIIYENAAPTNVKADAAASFEYQINTAYLQDEFTLANGDVTVVAGLRYDWYTSSDYPRENANFVARNGFSNAQNMDGKDLLQPRLGVTWEVNPDLSVRGGLGLYGGGNPNVWISNNYNNDGQTQVEVRGFLLDDIYPDGWTLFTVPHDGTGRPLWDIPQALVDAVASGEVDGDVNAIDPNFKLPSVWKLAVGFTWEFDAGAMGSDYILNGDLIYSKSEDSANIVRADLYQSGTAPDGRPIYSSTRRSGADFVLTNVEGPDGKALNLSLSLEKYYDSGLNWSLSYAYNDAEEVSPMNRFTASSSYAESATADPQHPELGRSYNAIKNRLTFRIALAKYWWGDNRSLISLFAHYNSGRPYALAYGFESGDVFGDDQNFRHLLYVPTGPDDPGVIFDPNFETEEFFAWADAEGLARGQIVGKYGETAPSWISFDLRLEQEFPAFRKDHKFAGFIVIKNLCNLLNSEWCVLERSVFNTVNPVDLSYNFDTGQYIYEEYNPVRLTRYTNESLYEIRVGLTYRF